MARQHLRALLDDNIIYMYLMDYARALLQQPLS
jgi:hypothetical protein